MSEAIKLSDDLALYSGDLIRLRANDGTYVKRYSSLKEHSALFCYSREHDKYSEFVVEVVDPNKIRLIADNEKETKSA